MLQRLTIPRAAEAPRAQTRRAFTAATWPALALLPVVIYAAVLFFLIRSLQTDDLTDRVRNAATHVARAFEAELNESLELLESLGGSVALERNNFDDFRVEAERLLLRRPRWQTITLTDRERDILNLRVGNDQPLPALQDAETLERVLESGRRAVGQLRNESITLRVPVLREGQVRYTVAVNLSLGAFSRILAEARLPAGWLAAVADAGFVVFARSGTGALRLGASAGPDFAAQATRGRFEIRRQTLPTGVEALTGIVPVPRTAWSVAVSVPTELVEAPLQSLRLALIVGGIWAFAVAVGLGAWVFRRSRRVVEEEAERLSADLARAEETDRRKSEFFTTISHELRTPLTGIVGFTDLLAGTKLSPTQRQWVEQQRRAGQALLTLIGDVLDFARIEEGAIELESVPFDLKDLLQDCAAIMRPLAEQKGLRLRADFSPDLPVTVQGDPLRLRQVVVNLLSNAIKFTREGEVALEVDADHMADGRVALHLSVADTGIGIPAARLPHVFDRFTQAEASTARGYGGSGLGLAICQRLVQAMGGSIWADSMPGMGSRFSLRLPMELADAPAPLVAAPVAQPVAAGTRVLVAEDSPANQMLLRTVLEQAGYIVELAADGAEAIELQQKHPCDIGVLDIRMPVMDGWGAARGIRGLAPPLGNIPLIALTADATTEVQGACRDAGFDAVMPKPFDTPRLLAELANLLNRRATLSSAAVTQLTTAEAQILGTNDKTALARMALGLARTAANAGAASVAAAARQLAAACWASSDTDIIRARKLLSATISEAIDRPEAVVVAERSPVFLAGD